MKKYLITQFSGHQFIVSGRTIAIALYNAGYQSNIFRSIKEYRVIKGV